MRIILTWLDPLERRVSGGLKYSNFYRGSSGNFVSILWWEKNKNFKFYETDGQRLNEINASLFNWVIGAKRSFLKLLERNTGWDSLQTQIDYPGSCVNHGHQKSRDGCNWGWNRKTEAKMWLWKIRRNSLSIWAPNIMFLLWTDTLEVAKTPN